MAQWEVCRAALVGWYAGGNEHDTKVVLHYFTPTGVITKFPSINSWGQILAILSAAEWEAITMQHGLSISAPHVGWSGGVRGMNTDHPSGEKIASGGFEGPRWQYDSCHMVAYFKRPIQAGRKIDDAL